MVLLISFPAWQWYCTSRYLCVSPHGFPNTSLDASTWQKFLPLHLSFTVWSDSGELLKNKQTNEQTVMRDKLRELQPTKKKFPWSSKHLQGLETLKNIQNIATSSSEFGGVGTRTTKRKIATTVLLLTGIDRSQPIAHRMSIYPFVHSLRSRLQSSVIQGT